MGHRVELSYLQPIRTVFVVGPTVLLGFERMASACPFCGGKGASGLFENLLLVAGLWFGARALMRWMQRRRQQERPPEIETTDGR
jgi:hypothetical protein